MLICLYTSNINPVGHHALFFNTGGFDMVMIYLGFLHQCPYCIAFLFSLPTLLYLPQSIFAPHLLLILLNQTMLLKLKTKVLNRAHNTLCKPLPQPPRLHLLSHYRCSPLSLLFLEPTTYTLASEHLSSLFSLPGVLSLKCLHGHSNFFRAAQMSPLK